MGRSIPERRRNTENWTAICDVATPECRTVRHSCGSDSLKWSHGSTVAIVPDRRDHVWPRTSLRRMRLIVTSTHWSVGRPRSPDGVQKPFTGEHTAGFFIRAPAGPAPCWTGQAPSRQVSVASRQGRKRGLQPPQPGLDGRPSPCAAPVQCLDPRDDDSSKSKGLAR